jgi:thiol-disulfide isomerase/thioredoxin
MKVIVCLVLIVCLGIGIFEYAKNRNSASSNQEMLNGSLDNFQSFPFDFEVTALDGTRLRLDDFRGRVLFVDFWGTWCPPCRAEIPAFVELQTKYGDAGLSVLGLNYERDENLPDAVDSINEFLLKQPINYPLAIGPPQVKASVPNFRGYPTTLLLDGHGKVRWKWVGGQSFATLEAAAKMLLKELPSPPSPPPEVIIRRTYAMVPRRTPEGKSLLIDNPFSSPLDTSSSIPGN